MATSTNEPPTSLSTGTEYAASHSQNLRNLFRNEITGKISLSRIILISIVIILVIAVVVIPVSIVMTRKSDTKATNMTIENITTTMETAITGSCNR
jgi:flagellar basal body-associated protein FliL